MNEYVAGMDWQVGDLIALGMILAAFCFLMWLSLRD